MKRTIPILILLSLLSCTQEVETAENSQNNTTSVEQQISGIIKDGLRYIKVDFEEEEMEYTIYRGDYIVFEFVNDSDYQFILPELEIDTIMPQPLGEREYVKMKNSGVYEFTLGEREGVFHILELTEPNYYELTSTDAISLINKVNPIIIDVRTPSEYASGHIENSKLLPVQILADNIDLLNDLKEEPILLYCQSGNRSTVAARILLDEGFSNIYNLRYGIGEWSYLGNPITTD